MKTFEDYLKEYGEFGYVESIVAPLVYVSGLPTVRPQELVITERGSRGIVQIILPDLVEVLMFDTHDLAHQEKVTRTCEAAGIEVSEGLLGRIIDSFGKPLDGFGPIGGKKEIWPIDKEAPGILERVKVTEPLETGVTIVDLLIQIGKGQKELVAGDQKTGKTTFLLQSVARQVQKGAICVYVFIGKKKSDLKYVEEHLKRTDALKNCVIVAATSSDPVSMVYFAPFSGFTIAEFFRDLGKEVLIILDDMTTHAKYYREIALVGKKTPGRGSYPGDIFHMQSRLLERTGRVKKGDGRTGSITALPVAETQEGDLTGYIQTNLMAMTDGHIFFDVEDLKRGKLPAINHTLSVTRVGNQTQSSLEKELRGLIVRKLANYYRVRETMSFGVSVPVEYTKDIDFGEKIELLFNQEGESIVPKAMQQILFGLLFCDFWTNKNLKQMEEEKDRLLAAYFSGKFQALEGEIAKSQNLKTLSTILKRFGTLITKEAYGNLQQKTT